MTMPPPSGDRYRANRATRGRFQQWDAPNGVLNAHDVHDQQLRAHVELLAAKYGHYLDLWTKDGRGRTTVCKRGCGLRLHVNVHLEDSVQGNPEVPCVVEERADFV